MVIQDLKEDKVMMDELDLQDIMEDKDLQVLKVVEEDKVQEVLKVLDLDLKVLKVIMVEQVIKV